MAVDPLLPLWLIVAGSIGAGIVAGIVLERTTGSAAKRAAKFEAELIQVRCDLTRHREETARHFGKSAELLGRMATDYREFLDHFVSGAEQLCGPHMKEISARELERPLLETARAATAPPPPPPMGSDPLAEDAEAPK
jgi:uncharacterized membrane-anchored protein YhcB (DUF1043 family)